LGDLQLGREMVLLDGTLHVCIRFIPVYPMDSLNFQQENVYYIYSYTRMIYEPKPVQVLKSSRNWIVTQNQLYINLSNVSFKVVHLGSDTLCQRS
jgi:hypothetical protein